MQDYIIVIIAVSLACVLLAAVLLTFILCRNSKRTKQKQAIVAPVRQPSILGIHPKIPDPIFTIPTPKSIEKESRLTDTLTTRKISMMFDARKRFSNAFNQRQSYFDFENSPQLRHKEYLDFNDIEKILPPNHTSTPISPLASDLSNIRPTSQPQHHLPQQQQQPQHKPMTDCPATRISIIEECPFGALPHIEPVREVFSENHVSFRRERPHVG